MVHDYQLTTIGNALKYFGYSFNSIDPKELADAEKLLMAAKPHLFAINSDYQPAMRNGDAWLTICWTGDGKQLNRDIPAIEYVIGKEGGEIWTDFYAIPEERAAPRGGLCADQLPARPRGQRERGAVPRLSGTPTRGCNALLPKELLDDPILYPAAESAERAGVRRRGRPSPIRTAPS